MPSGRFSIDEDDPTKIIEFRFLDSDGHLTKSSLKKALSPPYPAKYYVNVVLLIIGLTVFLLWNYGIIQGNQLGFFCNDPLFSHKYQGDTVTPWMLGVGLVFIFPLLYIAIEYIRQGSCRAVFTLDNLFEFYVYVKQLLMGELIVGGTTELAKTIVGEHRPHFFDTCMPDTNMNCTNGTYVFHFTCTNPNATLLDIIDSSRSFPSGHSSISWFAALFWAYVVHSRLPTKRSGTAFKILLLGVCVTFGLTCSLTRITDRRHHWWDVLTGTVLAFLGAIYVIRYTHYQIRTLHRKRVVDVTKHGPNHSFDEEEP